MSDKQDTDKQDKGQPADTMAAPNSESAPSLEERFARPGSKPKYDPPAAGDEPAAGGEPPSPPGPLGDAARDAPERDAPQPAIERKERLDEFRRRQRRNRALLDDEPAGFSAAPIRAGMPRQRLGVRSALSSSLAAKAPASAGQRPGGIAAAPGDARVYIAAANGGVWRSEDRGANWVSLMESVDLNPTTAASDSLECGAIALVPGASQEQDRLYVGTGEGAGAAYFGVGPVVSLDGGRNRQTEPVADGDPPLAGNSFFALAVDPTDPDRLVAATRSGLYLREPISGGQGGGFIGAPGAAILAWRPASCQPRRRRLRAAPGFMPPIGAVQWLA